MFLPTIKESHYFLGSVLNKKKNQSVIKLLIKLFCTKLKSASNFWSVIQTTLSLLHMKMSKQEDLTKPEVKTF